MARDSRGRRVPYIANRRWVDGSVTHDLPAKRLSRLYFANHFIVSQAHPLVAPLSDDAEQLPTLHNTEKKAATTTMKGWFAIAMRLLDQPLSLVPPLHDFASMMASVINQDYSGDINIIRPAMFWSPSKVLSPLSLEETERLIDIGKRCAWPKLEMIRVQTKIGRSLDNIATSLKLTV
jgi:NTE family protein